MTIESKNKQQIEKFFFGSMTEEERLKFEEMFITNAEFLAEVKTFEDDLIEKYVRNWLNENEKQKFETHFLNTKKRREKVEFARRLIAELNQQNLLQVEEKETFWQKLSALFSYPKFAMASVFTILLLGFGGWYLFRNVEPTQTDIVKNLPTENVNIKIINSNKNIETNLEAENINSNKNTEIKNIERKTPNVQRISTPVLALFAGTLRSDGELKELNLPQNSNGAVLQLNLPNIDYKAFQANLIDGNGNQIFQSKTLKPQKSKLNFFIPKNKLKKGDYRISLSGINTSGDKESAADFQFRVN